MFSLELLTLIIGVHREWGNYYLICETAAYKFDCVNCTPLGSPVVPDEQRIKLTLLVILIGLHWKSSLCLT